MSEYTKFSDLTKDQKMAVLAHVLEPDPSWLNGHRFCINKNGTVRIPLRMQPVKAEGATP